jgi:hypothetical protein
MSLTTRQRSSIYQKFLPILGEEDADAMLAQFPASEHDQLVTREHLRAELGILRSEIKDLRTEMMGEIGTLRTEMADLRTEMIGQGGTLRGEMHGLINRNSAAMTGILLAALGLLAAFD